MALANAYTKFGHVTKMRYRTERLLYVYTREDLNDGITQIRFKTDNWYLWVFVLFQFGLVILCTRYFIASDTKRLFNGLDSFGNTCGKRNSHFLKNPFSGMDHTNREYVMYLLHGVNSTEAALCVSACPVSSNWDIYQYAYPYMNIENLCYSIGNKCRKDGRKAEVPHWNRCYPEDESMRELLCKRDILKNYTLDVAFGILKLGFVIIIGFALTMFGVWLLQKHPSYFSKYAFISVLVACGVSTVYFWYLFLTSDFNNMDFMYFYHCSICINLMLAAIISFISMLVLWDFTQSGLLVKEPVLLNLCSGSIKNIPGICFSPLLIVATETVFLCFVVLMYFQMRSCYTPREGNHILTYKEPLFVKRTSWFFYLVSYWTLRFIFNCGLYLGSDTVCRWYFDPKASNGSQVALLQPAISSLVVYHLGSAVKGTIMYGFVNKFMILIFAPHYWNVKAKQLADKKFSIGHAYNFYEQFLRYIDPLSYTSMAMFGFDLQISSQITFVTLLSDFQIRHQNRMRQISKSIAHFKYSVLVITYFMLEFGAEASQDHLCAKNISVFAAFTMAYILIGDLCDLVEQIYHSMFMCLCTDFGCNISSDENNFTRRNLMKYYLHNIDEEEAIDKLVN